MWVSWAKGGHAPNFEQHDPLHPFPTLLHSQSCGGVYRPTGMKATILTWLERWTPRSSRFKPLAHGWQYPLMAEGVLMGASPNPAGVCLVVYCLFREQSEGGGRERWAWSWPWGSCCCAASRAPDTKQLIVIILLVTMSWPWSDSISEELTDSTTVSLATWTGASGSTRASGYTGTSSWTGASGWTSTCACSRRCRDTCLADSSRTGASSSEQVYHRPRSQASPTVNLGRRKFACRMSI